MWAADDDQQFLESVMELLEVCSGESTDERLFVLGTAWLVLAQRARNEQLDFPDGWPSEQARQLNQLKQMVKMVEGDKPDLELERLTREGDFEGAVRHIQKLWDDIAKGGA